MWKHKIPLSDLNLPIIVCWRLLFKMGKSFSPLSFICTQAFTPFSYTCATKVMTEVIWYEPVFLENGFFQLLNSDHADCRLVYFKRMTCWWFGRSFTSELNRVRWIFWKSFIFLEGQNIDKLYRNMKMICYPFLLL